MSPTVKPIPDGYPGVSPYLCVDGAASAMDFSTQVFGASERVRWSIQTHVEDVSPAVTAHRAVAPTGGGG